MAFRPEQCIVDPLPAQDDAWRVEIDELLADPAQTNLFLLALKKMQDDYPYKNGKDENWLSFYNLASIHGNPQERWNNVQAVDENPKDEEAYWYCTHSTDIFPTFHRAYLMAFERALSNAALEIANSYNQQQKDYYVAAAKRLRLPFWDPFMPRHKQAGNIQSVWGLPEILTVKRVWVRLSPDGKVDQIDNPLYQFALPDVEKLKKAGRVPIDIPASLQQNPPPPASAYKKTLRAPGKDGESDIALLERAIQMQGTITSTKVWQLLRLDPSNAARTWQRFSNHSFVDEAAKARRDPSFRQTPSSDRMGISLESWHDDIHVLAGSAVAWRTAKDQDSGNAAMWSTYTGYMAQVAVAAFDPIFWLHHNNIDRYFAIFQALFPDKYVSSDERVKENTKTWLRPFMNKDGSQCTSTQMRDWKHLRFAVPGVKDLDEAGRQETMRYLKENYYWTMETDPSKKVPPKGWPKITPNDNTFALRGEKASAGPAPVLKFDALETAPNGAPQLVRRAIAVPAPDAAPAQVEDKVPKVTSPIAAPAQKSTRVWNMYLTVKKFAFDGTFAVHAFIDEPAADSLGPMVASNEVGFSGVFAAKLADAAACANCARNQQPGADTRYEDVVPLTPYLEDLIAQTGGGPGLASLEPDAVVPFLTRFLKWRVVDARGEVKTDEQIGASELEISVWDRMFDAPTEQNKLGVYHDSRLHAEVTRGKVGGLR